MTIMGNSAGITLCANTCAAVHAACIAGLENHKSAAVSAQRNAFICLALLLYRLILCKRNGQKETMFHRSFSQKATKHDLFLLCVFHQELICCILMMILSVKPHVKKQEGE